MCNTEITKSRRNSLDYSLHTPSKNRARKGLIEIVNKCNKNYKNIIVTGDFNAKSKLLGNKTENYAGKLLERCMVTDNFVCVNDTVNVNTRRNSESVINLFIVKPHLNSNVSRCVTLTHESVRSDHIGILMEIADGESEVSETVEKYHIHKTDWDKWDNVTSAIVQFIFYFWSLEISVNILRNRKKMIGLDSYSRFLTIWTPF